MKKFLMISAGVLVALAVGVGSAILMIVDTLDKQGVHNGPWTTYLSAGSEGAGLYGRTAIAIGGLLALNKEETIYYNATHDSDGDRLTEACDYEVVGVDPDARWWSITAYAFDNYLLQNEDKHHSISQTTIQREADGSFVINVSAVEDIKNWISSNKGGDFALTLRLYNPGASVYEQPEAATLPKIVKGACQ